MELVDQFKYKSRIIEILPNTKRTLERRQKQLAEEMQRKKEAENLLKAQEEQQKQFKQLMKEQELRKKMEEDKRKEDERRKQEEMQSINTLKGEFGQMINDLKTDASKLDYTLSGLDLKPAQIRILLKATETNQTLRGLTINRKRITDDEGVELIKCVIKNNTLERLEMEGNFMGSKTLMQVAELIENNRCIKVIDLENNDLTSSGKEVQGFYQMCQKLANNDSLLCLNLNNTCLDERCGQFLLEALQKNEFIINIDIENNPKMNLHDVSKIQEALKRNKKAYDEERYREFIERKRLRKEEDISQILQLKTEHREIVEEGIEQRLDARRKQLDHIWNSEMDYSEMIRQKEIAKLLKEAELRKGKKKKRGGKKKK